LVCKVALSVLDVFEEDAILVNVNAMSNYIKEQLKINLEDCSAVIQIRAKGLMIGIGLDESIIDCTQLLQKALEDELLINITGNSIRMLPPLIITQQEADILIKKIIKLINA
jgi:acetylornithine aminotransferase